MTKSNYKIIVGLLLAGAAMIAPLTSFAQIIDGSSKENFEASVDAILEEISEADKACFQSGFMDLILTEHPEADGRSSFEMLTYLGENPQDYPDYLDGLTGEEIIARGQDVSDCEAQNTASNSVEEISSNPQEALKSCLAEKIEVSNLIVEKAMFGDEINFTLTNNLDWAISGIRVEYSVASPERSIPWVQDDQSNSISGGIEAGESRDLSISVTGINGSIPAEVNRDDLEVELTVVDVADANGDQLVHEVNVIGGNWSGETSTQQCE